MASIYVQRSHKRPNSDIFGSVGRLQLCQILDVLILRVSGAEPKRLTLLLSKLSIQAPLHYPGQRVAYTAP